MKLRCVVISVLFSALVFCQKADAQTVELDLAGGTSGQITVEATEEGVLDNRIKVPEFVGTVTYEDAWGSDVQKFYRKFLGFWYEGVQYYNSNGMKMRDIDSEFAGPLVARWEDVTVTLAAPYHAGYEFEGYYYDENFGRMYVGDGTLVNPAGLVLYRKYVKDNGVLTFVNWEDPLEEETQRVEFNEYFDVTKPKKEFSVKFEGCSIEPITCKLNFGGYRTQDGVMYVDASGTGIKRWDRTDESKVYAIWAACKLNVISPIKTGYVFKGWSTKGLNGPVEVKELKNFSVLKDTVFYAVWDKASYTVNLSPENGEVDIEFGINYHDQYPDLVVPERTGYKFEGYYTKKNGLGEQVYDSEGKSDKKYTQNGNQFLYAMWVLHKVNKVKTLTIGKGESFYMANGSDFVKYSTENGVSVSGIGTGRVVMTGTKVGTFTVVLENSNGRLTQLTVIVKRPPNKVTTIKSLTISKGDEYRIKTSLPKGTASYSIKFSSSNKKIASVSSSGYVEAKKKGSCTITVSLYNGKSSKIKVKVR